MTLKEQLESLSEEELMKLLVEHPIIWAIIENPTPELLMMKQLTD